MKKLLMIVIDACASRVMIPAIKTGKLPNIQAVVDAGAFHPACSAIFPSITHPATASIVTGCYPRDHGIAGAYWYSTDEDEFVYYSTDFWVILNQGVEKFFEDFVVKLNHHRLQAETLFQTVERAGLQAACLNHIIFRGDVPHSLDIPRLVSLLPGIPSSEVVYGPSMLSLGDLVTKIPYADEVISRSNGLLNRFGFTDDYTADLLVHLASKRAFPEFTLAYFPDNDIRSHQVGPEAAVTVLEQIDRRLSDLFAVYGGPQQMLQELCVVLTGDHAQSDIVTDITKAGIRLDEILVDFSLVEAGQPWSRADQVVVCPDMRTAKIYLKQPTPAQLTDIITPLLEDPRIDQVMSRARDNGIDKPGYYITTAERGTLHFWSGSDGLHTAEDEYGNQWSWTGDLSPVDGQLTGNILTFPDYPNAFERISGGLDCQGSGQVWVTARPGYEFGLAETTIHNGGGSHGSLHALDSLVPLIIAGAPEGLNLPPNPRTVDVTPLCLAVLELQE